MSRGRDLPPVPPQEESPYAELIHADILLPTGMMLTLNCHKSTTLAEMKNNIWQEARSFPLFDHMKHQGFYSFIGIVKDGNKDEFVNENRTVGDLNLFTPLLKLEERQGNMEEKRLKSDIGALIGRKLTDFDVMEAEVQDCRRHWLDVCEEAVNERQKTQASLIRYNYSAVLVGEQDPGVSHYITGHSKHYMDVLVCYFGTRGQKNDLVLPTKPGTKPAELVNMVFSAPDFRKAFKKYRPSDFCLKVQGKEEYLLEDVPLYRFKYMADCLVKSIQPKLCLVQYDELTRVQADTFIRPVHGQHNSQPRPTHVKFNPFELCQGTIGRDPNTYVTTWNIKRLYQLKVLSAKNCNIQETMKVYVRAALYYGDQTLCPVVCTKKGANPENPVWNENLEFVLPVAELPRSTKLCFLVYQQKQAGRKSKEDGPLAWANLNVFNYAGMLEKGKRTLYAWPIGDEHELQDQVNYIGATVPNPNHDECFQLTIDIPSVSPNNPYVMFPSAKEVEQFAFEMAQGATLGNRFTEEEFREVKRLTEQDPLDELDEQGKEFIWKARNLCRERIPRSLPKVLQSVTWNNRSDVAQVYLLLLKWAKLSPEDALELLHYKYADIAVRLLAVKCLEVLSDDKLVMYLLQLVQVLKFEPYLDCPLAEFLLRRGLRNKTIGHYLFWHLRAEMHLPTVSVRYGLMLEAYCRGCGKYRETLSDQMESLQMLTQLTSELTKMKKAKAEDSGKDYLRSSSFVKCMEKLRSPLDPFLQTKRIDSDRCKVMDSKMKPVWLHFENMDTLGDNILHIFKNGDDLRQDMLTLQVMSIMDSFWKQAGHDLRMKPYQCLSMGDQVGLIEVVTSAATIAKIQKKQGARGAFDKKLLYQWLKEKNKTTEELDKAIETFTLSCAGCCVATYVLGIGDRHSDNIMLRENGQLVHIDFGHFLGNFKSKFGVKRERVPFVLTDDFIYIITREKNKDAPEFTKFKMLCEEAFLILRQQGSLFINLFTMMMSTGIPELRSVDDVRYISNALCLAKTEEQALEDFRKKLHEALKHSWSVSVNWYFHSMAH